MPLTAEQCEACRTGSPLVTDAEERELKPQIPDWEITDTNGVRKLKRTYKLHGWMPAVEFATAIANLAETEDHHPSLLITWGKVTITWWTHAIKGLHRNDFIMAAKSDQTFESIA